MGTPWRQGMPESGTQIRVENLSLAVNGLEGTLYWEWIPNMKAEEIAKVVEHWQAKDIEIMVWDRAPGHRGKDVKKVGAKLVEGKM